MNARSSSHSVRHALARLTALVVLGLSLAAAVGVSSPRVGVRDRSRGVRSLSRSGMQRLDSMDAHLHEHDEPASVQSASDDRVNGHDRQSPPSRPATATQLTPPGASAQQAPRPPSSAPRPLHASLSPPGRAPPLA